MLSYSNFIVKDGNIFFFDLEDYNSKSDITVEEGDTIKFTYEGEKYVAKVATIGSTKNQSFVLDITKKY